ncbi:MAG: translation factor GTPase family protein, partial [Nakamurella sp.]
VASFVAGDTTINLIDTPGHPDFIAEVERALRVLDGVILVISAVEGVQAQTIVLMRVLRRLRIPTLLFVNKIDRPGADIDGLLTRIRERLSHSVIVLGSVADIGTAEAQFVPYQDESDHFGELLDLLAESNDAVLAAFVRREESVTTSGLMDELARQSRLALVHPVFCGSAMTGAGIALLMRAITTLLPTATERQDSRPTGVVFKIERTPGGEKIAYVRMFSGTLRARDRVQYRRGDAERPDNQKVIAISSFPAGAGDQSIAAGQIGRIWGLQDCQIGDTIEIVPSSVASCAERTDSTEPGTPASSGHFAPPTLETVVLPTIVANRAALHTALQQLAEQDPLINLREDTGRREISVSLYGEVQKEVIAATLANDFGLEVTFEETTTICVERVVGDGAAVEFIGIEPNPFLATVGLRIESAARNTGPQFRLGVELGSMPLAFFRAVEETVAETLQQGLYGWQVVDSVVTMTHSGYWARQSHAGAGFDKSMSSTAGDFRLLTPLVVMAALQQARTEVLEPIHRFQVDLPAESLSSVLAALSRYRAVPRTSTTAGSTVTVQGDVPVACLHALTQQLPGLTHGRAMLEAEFDRYEPVRGPLPLRSRRDANPLSRKEYLLHVQRRV